MNVATSCKPVQTLGAISHTMPVTLTWKGRNKDHDFSAGYSLVLSNFASII